MILQQRWMVVWQRNFRVLLKLFIPFLLGNFGDPLIYLLALGYGLGRFVGSLDGIPYFLLIYGCHCRKLGREC